jgi:hypothetical protein
MEKQAYVVTRDGSPSAYEWETLPSGVRQLIRENWVLFNFDGKYKAFFHSKEECERVYREEHEQWRLRNDGHQAPRMVKVICHYGVETGQLYFITDVGRLYER